MNLQLQRELKTLCLAVDYLATKHPARAADLLSQKVKSIEKAGTDGYWGSAQYLKLVSPEMAGLLDCEEEIYINREFLQELKLRGMEKN